MSVELKNWKELCKEKDERIKELEGKFDLIVEKLEEEKQYHKGIAEEELNEFCLEMYHYHTDMSRGINCAIEIVKEVGGVNENRVN